jgi:hypothetical protein
LLNFLLDVFNKVIPDFLTTSVAIFYPEKTKAQTKKAKKNPDCRSPRIFWEARVLIGGKLNVSRKNCCLIGGTRSIISQNCPQATTAK